MTVTPALAISEVDRAAITPYLDLLSGWLLPDCVYGVEHTWPQLYRSDGSGHFFAAFEDERLRSHCAVRIVTARTADGDRRIALLGSVATDPDWRGRGLGQRVLEAAIAACRTREASAILLWAERPELYTRVGFRPSRTEKVLLLDSTAAPSHDTDVRVATVEDHGQLHSLHEAKPMAVQRSAMTMSGLLTTPGMWTYVLERQGRIAAYACSGKGADLQNWWHEVGGGDADLAALLPSAARLLGADRTFALCPAYRKALPELLGPAVADLAIVDGPMVLELAGHLPEFWVDGLDSV